MAALRLSIQYGHGDLHWFDALPHEDKVALLAYERIRAAEMKKAQGGRP